MSPRKAAGRELSREEILQAARERFVSSGYHSVSMREIAKKLGCSHGAIYYHFKDKAELFSALVAQDFCLLDQKLEQIVAASCELRKILLGFIEFGLTHPHHYEVMFLTGKEFLHQSSAAVESYGKFAYYVTKTQTKPLSPKTVWSLFLALHGFVSHYLRSGLSFADIEELADSYVSILMKGIS